MKDSLNQIKKNSFKRNLSLNFKLAFELKYGIIFVLKLIVIFPRIKNEYIEKQSFHA